METSHLAAVNLRDLLVINDRFDSNSAMGSAKTTPMQNTPANLMA
jgi:hypothetical protein